MLAHQPDHHPFEPGEVVTTGTLTAALAINADETWHSAFSGAELPGLTVRFV